MCGIFGTFGSSNTQLKRALALLNRSRGEHATGLATKNTNENQFKWAKAAFDVKDVLADTKILEKDKELSGNVLGLLSEGDQYFLGHTRRASPAIGKTGEHDCAHPFHYNGAKHEILMAHNGYVQNFSELQDKYKGKYPHVKDFNVDSQILSFLIAEHGVESLSQVQGKAALWWIDYKNINRVNFWLWKQDFSCGTIDDTFAFSSEPGPLRVLGGRSEDVKSIRQDKGYLFYWEPGLKQFNNYLNKKNEVKCILGKELKVKAFSTGYSQADFYRDKYTERTTNYTHQQTRPDLAHKTVNKYHHVSLPLPTSLFDGHVAIGVGWNTVADRMQVTGLQRGISSLKVCKKSSAIQRLCNEMEELCLEDADTDFFMYDAVWKQVTEMLLLGTLPEHLQEEAMEHFLYPSNMDDIPIDEPCFSVIKESGGDLEHLFDNDPKKFYVLNPESVDGFKKNLDNKVTDGSFVAIRSKTDWNSGNPVDVKKCLLVGCPRGEIIRAMSPHAAESGWITFPTSRATSVASSNFKAKGLSDGLKVIGFVGDKLYPAVVPTSFDPVGVDYYGNLLLKNKVGQYGILPVNTHETDAGESMLDLLKELSAYAGVTSYGDNEHLPIKGP